MAKESRMGSVRIDTSHHNKMKRLLKSIDKSWKWFVLGLPYLTFEEFEQIYLIIKKAYVRNDINADENTNTSEIVGTSSDPPREKEFAKAG